MKPVSGKRLARVLEDRGWVFIRSSGSHFVYQDSASGKRVSVPMHGSRDLATGTQRRIMKDADLEEDDL